MNKFISLLFLTAIILASGCIDAPSNGVIDGSVQDWECIVTEDYNATIGGGGVYEGGDCAVLQAGCRRQSQCTIIENHGGENTWVLENLNINDPEIQRRLR